MGKSDPDEPVPPSQSLTRSLAAGEKINDIPSLDVKRSGDHYTVVDQERLRRAQAAMDAGVSLIPVAIKGATGGATQLVGMGGQIRPFDFKPVPKPPTTPSVLDRIGTGLKDV